MIDRSGIGTALNHSTVAMTILFSITATALVVDKPIQLFALVTMGPDFALRHKALTAFDSADFTGVLLDPWVPLLIALAAVGRMVTLSRFLRYTDRPHNRVSILLLSTTIAACILSASYRFAAVGAGAVALSLSVARLGGYIVKPRL